MFERIRDVSNAQSSCARLAAFVGRICVCVAVGGQYYIVIHVSPRASRAPPLLLSGVVFLPPLYCRIPSADAPVAMNDVAHCSPLSKPDAGGARACVSMSRIIAGFRRVLAALHPRFGRSRRIGLRARRAGKSTLSTGLTAAYRAALTVGVVAVTLPPFTEGAARDRIRRIVSARPRLIRSMALAAPRRLASTSGSADVLDGSASSHNASNRWRGQTSSTSRAWPIRASSRSFLTELDPDAQGGLIEIATCCDHKADRPGRMREAEVGLCWSALDMHSAHPAHPGGVQREPARWRVRRRRRSHPLDAPVLPTWDEGGGIHDLIGAIDRHFAYLERSGELRARRRQRLRERVVEVVEDRVRARLWRDDATNAWIEERLAELESGALTPFAAADALLKRSGDLLTRGRT